MRKWIIAVLMLCVCPVLYGRGKTLGWCQDGNYTVTVPGGAAPSANKYQRSFATCTVTVYDAGTVTLSTIYSDDAGTVKANPFTAASSGQWFFYADDGRYDVRFSSGGIPAAFTLGDVTNLDPVRAWGTSVRIVDGKKFKSVKAAYDDGPSTGTWVYVPASRTETVQVMLTAGKPLHLSCASRETTITWNTAGYYIDTQADGLDSIDGGLIENCSFSIGTTGTGFMRLGRAAVAFAEPNWHLGWELRNVKVDGVDPTVAGRVGLNLSQVANSKFSNIIVGNFETDWIADRETNNVYSDIIIWLSRYGLSIVKSDNPGLDVSTFSGLFILTPTTGNLGYGLKVDHGGNTFVGLFVEPGILGAETNGIAVWVTVNGRETRFVSPYWGNPAEPGLTTYLQIDAGGCDTQVYSPLTPITGGKPVTLGVPDVYPGCQHQFYGGNKFFHDLLVVNNAAYFNYIGGDTTSPEFSISSQILNVTGTLRAVGIAAATVPLTRKGWETYYDTVADQAVTNIVDRGGGGIYKPWLVFPSAMFVVPAAGQLSIETGTTVSDVRTTSGATFFSRLNKAGAPGDNLVIPLALTTSNSLPFTVGGVKSETEAAGVGTVSGKLCLQTGTQAAVADRSCISSIGVFTDTGIAFAVLNVTAPGAGMRTWCSDCTVASDPCTGVGNGTWAFSISTGAGTYKWKCM